MQRSRLNTVIWIWILMSLIWIPDDIVVFYLDNNSRHGVRGWFSVHTSFDSCSILIIWQTSSGIWNWWHLPPMTKTVLKYMLYQGTQSNDLPLTNKWKRFRIRSVNFAEYKGKWVIPLPTADRQKNYWKMAFFSGLVVQVWWQPDSKRIRETGLPRQMLLNRFRCTKTVNMKFSRLNIFNPYQNLEGSYILKNKMPSIMFISRTKEEW